MDDDEYDEFGNLIGDPLDSDADSSSDAESVSPVNSGNHSGENSSNSMPIDRDAKTASLRDNDNSMITTHNEAKQVGLRATFGPEVETIVVKPSMELKDEPVILPDIQKKLRLVLDKSLPEVVYSREYMLQTMSSLPERIRNVAVVGNFHSGKTSLIDLFIHQTHPTVKPATSLKSFRPLRYLDNHFLELHRGMSIKLSPVTLLLPDLNDRSYILNLVDTPGHYDFADETIAALEATDGAVVVLDAVEGLTPRDKALISQLMKRDMPMTFVLNKIDRLILELRLPPLDTYLKLQYIVDDVLSFVEENEFHSAYSHKLEMSPASGHFLFASATYCFCFSLETFGLLYARNHENLETAEFSEKLWGDWYYDPTTNNLTSKPHQKLERTFVKLVLAPVYKLFTAGLTSNSAGESIAPLLWLDFGVQLDKSKYKQDVQILLKDVFRSTIGTAFFVDLVSANIVSPEKISSPESNSPVLAHIVKLIENSDGLGFDSLVRIHKGTLTKGQKVTVYGDNYAEDDENYRSEIIDGILIPGGRYNFEVEEAGEGSIVLVKGIDSIVSKSGTVAVSDDYIFPNQSYSAHSVFKVAIEPFVPNDLPKMLDGLRKVSKSYLACSVKVEDSGEHLVFGSGELYLDCVLHDLRNFFTDELEIKVSDPMPKFSETCSETSFTVIPTQSGENSISIIAEPVNDTKLSLAIENGVINLSEDIKSLSKKLRLEYGWDALASRSVWCFGPDDMQSPSILLDDTLESETDKKLLYSAKSQINLGFKWSVNEGPLCDEPIRNTKFKILDAAVSGAEISRGGARLIPLSRKACYTGFLTASPRLMEPYYRVHGTCPHRAISVFTALLSKRRGYLESETPVPGTGLFQVEGLVPVIEAVGLETEIRLNTQGQAMCFLVFDLWNIVPGDPLDETVPLPTMKPVPDESLARDFVLKTRRRKGLSGEPSLQKYVDQELYQSLKDNGLVP
jgi:U5 small nuclear ribonucleoprotein component